MCVFPYLLPIAILEYTQFFPNPTIQPLFFDQIPIVARCVPIFMVKPSIFSLNFRMLRFDSSPFGCLPVQCPDQCPPKGIAFGERDGHFFPKALFVAKTKVGEFFLKTYPEMLPDYICKEKHTLSFCERYIIDYQAKIPGNPTAWPCCGCAPKRDSASRSNSGLRLVDTCSICWEAPCRSMRFAAR